MLAHLKHSFNDLRHLPPHMQHNGGGGSGGTTGSGSIPTSGFIADRLGQMNLGATRGRLASEPRLSKSDIRLGKIWRWLKGFSSPPGVSI